MTSNRGVQNIIAPLYAFPRSGKLPYPGFIPYPNPTQHLGNGAHPAAELAHPVVRVSVECGDDPTHAKANRLAAQGAAEELESLPKGALEKAQANCLQNAQCLNVAISLGPDYTVRVKPLRRWAEDFGGPIGVAALSALNIVNHPERIGNHILIIYIDFLGTAAKAPYTHDIVDAEVLSVNDLTRKVHPPDREPFLRLHTPLLGKIRVLLRFSWSHPMNFLLPPADAVHRLGLDPSWFEHLQIAVTHAGQPIRPRGAVEVNLYYTGPNAEKCWDASRIVKMLPK
ncbi:hypothetical protein B0H13DRAFT_2300837 [Mycena leptocephala]|nr:hypothetical protein B0H13DRAFT_2300837 [Mycena leptocephala]